MQGYLRAVLTSIQLLTLLSATPLPSVHAHIHWYGNDNGEWQEDGIPTYVNVEAWLNPQGLAFNPPPHGEISLQYNPERTNPSGSRTVPPIGSRPLLPLTQAVVPTSIFRSGISLVVG